MAKGKERSITITLTLKKVNRQTINSFFYLFNIAFSEDIDRILTFFMLLLISDKSWVQAAVESIGYR
jgi:hypothetical protein